MTLHFSQTHLQRMTLLMVMSHALKDAQKQVASILSVVDEVPKREFFFELVMNQNGIKQTVYIRYIEVSETANVPGGVQKITVPEGDYVTFSLSLSDYDREDVSSILRDRVNTYFEEHRLQADPSNVFALFEETDTHVVAYLPFRRI